jgi:hypothetical protein
VHAHAFKETSNERELGRLAQPDGAVSLDRKALFTSVNMPRWDGKVMKEKGSQLTRNFPRAPAISDLFIDLVY